MLDTVKINHVQHISFTQSRLTDAVSVILSELLSYEHPSKGRGLLPILPTLCGGGGSPFAQNGEKKKFCGKGLDNGSVRAIIRYNKLKR